MAAPVVVSATPAGVASGTTLLINKPAGLVDGDVLVVIVRSQGTMSGTTPITIPSGWTRGAGPNGNADRAEGIFYKPIPSAAGESATNYTFGGWSTGRSVGAILILRGVDLTDIDGGGVGYAVTDPGAFTADGTPYTVINAWGDERLAGQSHVPATTPAGYTLVVNAQNTLDASTSGSRTAIWSGSFAVTEGGSTAVAAVTLTWPTGTTASRAASVAFMGTATETPMGVPVLNGLGETVYASYLDASEVRTAPASIRTWYPGFPTIGAALAVPGATMAHRGGSLNYPEMSQIAYDRSVTRGFGVLEFSCGWSSDLVPFGLGDQTLDRVAGVTGDIDPTTLTWATISSTYQNVLRPIAPGVYQPLYRLEDFLAKYSETHTLMIDPKFGFNNATKVNAMLDLCDMYGGPDQIVIKFDTPTSDVTMTTLAHGRGYLCMNYWGGSANSAAMAAQQGNWDIIGALYSDATMMTQAGTYGKPVWAAVVPDQAGYNTAITNGADLVMCSNVAGIAPVSFWN